MNGGRMAMIGVTAALALMAGGLEGCNRSQKITRVDPNQVIDLDYRFTEDDARMVYQAMVNDALYRKWIDRWLQSSGGRQPVVIIGPVKNNTQDYIDTEAFTGEWERELLNSERVRFVAAKDERGALREERASGQEWNTPETRKQMKAELGADLMLLGTITDSTQRSPDGRQVVKTYKVQLQLVNIESNEVAWRGSHDIKKFVERSG